MSCARRVYDLPSLKVRSRTGRFVITDVRSGITREARADELRFVAKDDGLLPPGTEILATSADHSRTARLKTQNDQTTLFVRSNDSPDRDLWRINAHLKGLYGGEAVRIEHTGIRGEKLRSWLLLPPSSAREPGPLPTIVNVYPGAGDEPRWSKVTDMAPLNDQILVAQGYAVLYRTIPESPEIPRDTLPGLAPQVLMAVDAAVAAGYIDAERLAIQGHSFGGYAVLGVIGQTKRFKAAVALSGLYNLLSLYGSIDVSQRMAAEFDGPDLGGIETIESGQVGIGSAPWKDLSRYLRNSPLLLAPSIATPVMLIHGDQDYIPLAQAEEMFVALHRLGKDAVLVRYWGESHRHNSPANIRDLWNRMLAWYKTHLGRACDTLELALKRW